jgi:hypothetical protein
MFQKMKRNTVFLVVFILIASSNIGFAQYNFKNSEIFQYQKNEINWGLHYAANPEMEETRTEFWREYEEFHRGCKVSVEQPLLEFSGVQAGTFRI